jgi:hypothetical protein
VKVIFGGEKSMTPLEPTEDETRLLRDLEQRGGRGMISGNKNHRGLRRLVEAGYVADKRGAPDAVLYEITEVGLIALSRLKS